MKILVLQEELLDEEIEQVKMETIYYYYYYYYYYYFIFYYYYYYYKLLDINIF